MALSLSGTGSLGLIRLIADSDMQLLLRSALPKRPLASPRDQQIRQEYEKAHDRGLIRQFSPGHVIAPRLKISNFRSKEALYDAVACILVYTFRNDEQKPTY